MIPTTLAYNNCDQNLLKLQNYPVFQNVHVDYSLQFQIYYDSVVTNLA